MTLSKELNKYQQQIVIIFLTLAMLILFCLKEMKQNGDKQTPKL